MASISREGEHASLKQYDFITEIIFEGVPGAGKSTAIFAVAKHYAEKYDYTIYVNGKPHECQQNERAISEFLQMRYDPKIRKQRVLTTSCIGVRMAAERLEAYERMGKEHEKSGKKVIHFMERDDFTAIRLFLPAAYVHLRPAIEWIDFKGMMTEFDAVSTTIHSLTQPSVVLVIYFDIDAQLAYERVQKRNRPIECRGLEEWYMRYLKAAHDAYLGLISRKEKEYSEIIPAPLARRTLSVIDVNEYDGKSISKLVSHITREVDKHIASVAETCENA